MPLFFLHCRDHGERGARAETRNFALYALFSLWGYSHICESANGSHGAKIGARTARAATANTETPRTAQFLRPSRIFLGSVVLSAGWNGSKRLQAIFGGFTAHGLKARNGSRTRQGSPKAEQGRSGNRKHADRQPLCQPLGQPKSPDAHAHTHEEIVGFSVGTVVNSVGATKMSYTFNYAKVHFNSKL